MSDFLKILEIAQREVDESLKRNFTTDILLRGLEYSQDICRLTSIPLGNCS